MLFIALILAGCSAEDSNPGLSDSNNAWLSEQLQSESYTDACAQTPGCEVATAEPAENPRSLWRVMVVRDPAGQIHIDSVSQIQVASEDQEPVGALYGNYALVGLDADGEVLDGYLLQFPQELRIEGEQGTRTVDLAGKTVDTIAYLRVLPNIKRIGIQNQAGEVLHSEQVPEIGMPLSARFGSWLGLSSAHAVNRPFAGLSPDCSHIIVLQGEADRRLAGGIAYEDTIKLVNPGPYQLAAARAAINRMTPLLCQSVGRIAFGRVPGEGFLGNVESSGAGDMMLINVVDNLSAEDALETMMNRRLMLQNTIIHEAGHAAETLLTYESSNPGEYSGAWSFPARTLADRTVKNVRLEIGLPEEWQRIHESFVDQGWAQPHGVFAQSGDGADTAEYAAEDIVFAGFMSEYASRNWAEDIAATIGETYLSRPTTDAYREHGVADSLRQDKGCLVMRKYQEKNLPSRFAALYTKLKFLEDLGLVRPENVEDCTGGKLGLPIDVEGFQVWQEGMKLRSFQNQLEAVLGSRSGVKVFEMKASGEAGFGDEMYPAEMRLQLGLGQRFTEFDKLSWPRGVYKLGLTGNTNFTLRLDGAAAGNFNAMDGFVLVAQASNKKIAGSVVLQRVFRLQAPLPVPELYDPPLIVRFLIEKQGESQ